MTELSPRDLLDHLGLDYSERTNRLSMRCCFHDDRTPSSGFYLDSNLFSCFTCSITLSMSAFYAKFKEITLDEAREELRRIFGKEVKETPRIDRKKLIPTKGYLERKLQEQRGVLSRRDFAEMGDLIDKITWALETGRMAEEQIEGAVRKWELRMDALLV